jgi:hypothetical protein
MKIKISELSDHQLLVQDECGVWFRYRYVDTDQPIILRNGGERLVVPGIGIIEGEILNEVTIKEVPPVNPGDDPGFVLRKVRE